MLGIKLLRVNEPELSLVDVYVIPPFKLNSIAVLLGSSGKVKVILPLSSQHVGSRYVNITSGSE